MSTVVTGFDALTRTEGPNTLLLKGAPERVIEKSKNYKREDGSVADFTPAEKQQLISRIQE